MKPSGKTNVGLAIYATSAIMGLVCTEPKASAKHGPLSHELYTAIFATKTQQGSHLSFQLVSLKRDLVDMGKWPLKVFFSETLSKMCFK